DGLDWVLCARAGRDGHDGASLNLRGPFDVNTRYERLDVVEFGGDAFVARRNGPGLCPGEDWLPLSARGSKGDKGETGPRGPPGDRGAAEQPVTICSWLVDPERYRASPLLSNGQVGAILDLRPLFELFQKQTSP